MQKPHDLTQRAYTIAKERGYYDIRATCHHFVDQNYLVFREFAHLLELIGVYYEKDVQSDNIDDIYKALSNIVVCTAELSGAMNTMLDDEIDFTELERPFPPRNTPRNLTIAAARAASAWRHQADPFTAVRWLAYLIREIEVLCDTTILWEYVDRSLSIIGAKQQSSVHLAIAHGGTE